MLRPVVPPTFPVLVALALVALAELVAPAALAAPAELVLVAPIAPAAPAAPAALAELVAQAPFKIPGIAKRPATFCLRFRLAPAEFLELAASAVS